MEPFPRVPINRNPTLGEAEEEEMPVNQLSATPAPRSLPLPGSSQHQQAQQENNNDNEDDEGGEEEEEENARVRLGGRLGELDPDQEDES